MASAKKSGSRESPNNTFKEACRHGDGKAALEMLKSGRWKWQDNRIEHPLWDMLKSRSLSAVHTLEILKVLVEEGLPMDFPALACSPLPPRRLTDAEKVRLLAPLNRSQAFLGNDAAGFPTVLSRVLAMPEKHKRVMLGEYLESIGVKPTENEWISAAGSVSVGTMRRWWKAGFRPESTSSLFQGFLNGSRQIFTSENITRMLDFLDEVGFKPSAQEMKDLSQGSLYRVMVQMAIRHPSACEAWSLEKRVEVLCEFWQGLSSEKDDISPLLDLLQQDIWQRALFDEKQSLHGLSKSPLSHLTFPTCISFIHGRYLMGGHEAIAWKRFFDAWSHRIPCDAMALEGWTHGELWAFTQDAPSDELAQAFPAYLKPNPVTGRWPVAASSPLHINHWFNDEYSFKRAMEDPLGPIGEWAYRAIVERNAALSRWVEQGLEMVPDEGLGQGYRGASLEVWCSARKDLASAWKSRTGRRPLDGKVTSASIRVLALAGTPTALGRALDKLSSEALSSLQSTRVGGKGLIEELIGLDWAGNIAARDRRMDAVMLLKDKGLPFPQEAAAWSSFSGMWEKKGLRDSWDLRAPKNPSLSHSLEWWHQFSPGTWPSCLSSLWLDTLIYGAGLGMDIDTMLDYVMPAMPKDAMNDIVTSLLSPEYIWKHNSISSWTDKHYSERFVKLASALLSRLDPETLNACMKTLPVVEWFDQWVVYQGTTPDEWERDRFHMSPYMEGFKDSLPYLICEDAYLSSLVHFFRFDHNLSSKSVETSIKPPRLRL